MKADEIHLTSGELSRIRDLQNLIEVTINNKWPIKIFLPGDYNRIIAKHQLSSKMLLILLKDVEREIKEKEKELKKLIK